MPRHACRPGTGYAIPDDGGRRCPAHGARCTREDYAMTRFHRKRAGFAQGQGAILAVGVWLLIHTAFGANAAETGKVDFNRDVRRILSENCFSCHGPDSKPRKGSGKVMRLDHAESAYADHGGIRAIVPEIGRAHV